MNNKIIEDLKIEQEEAIVDHIAYLHALEAHLNEWNSENDEKCFHNLSS